MARGKKKCLSVLALEADILFFYAAFAALELIKAESLTPKSEIRTTVWMPHDTTKSIGLKLYLIA